MGDLVHAVVPMLSEPMWTGIPQASLEVFTSASFHDPAVVAASVPGSLLASLVAEDADRSPLVELEPLNVLTCGMMVANLVGVAWDDEDAKSLAADRLSKGTFVGNLLLAMEASATRSAWPSGTGAFHSPARLAKVVKALANNGYSHRLVQVVPALAQVAQGMGECVTSQALQSLSALCDDLACREALLEEVTFCEALVQLSEDSTEAAELLSLLQTDGIPDGSLEAPLTELVSKWESSEMHGRLFEPQPADEPFIFDAPSRMQDNDTVDRGSGSLQQFVETEVSRSKGAQWTFHRSCLQDTLPL